MKKELHCTSIDCDSRRSKCCDAKCKVFKGDEKGLISFKCSTCGNEFVAKEHSCVLREKHICCDGECNHDDCCGKVEENCPLYVNPDVLKNGYTGKFEVTSELPLIEERKRIHDRVSDFLGQKYKDIPRIHPFYEGTILDIIMRPSDDNPKEDK